MQFSIIVALYTVSLYNFYIWETELPVKKKINDVSCNTNSALHFWKYCSH